MTTYDLGDTVPLSIDVTDAAGAATNCSTMVLTVTLPDGTTATPALTNTPTGTYYADYVPATAGLYRYRFAGTVPSVALVDDFRAIGDSYATIDDLKSYLGIGDTVDDDELYVVLDAAHAWIDAQYGPFTRATSATARTYRDLRGGILRVDPIATATGLVVAGSDGDGTYTTTTADYVTYPDNAIAKGQPITGLRFISTYPSCDAYGVQVTAVWGWPAVPADVTNATLILASRLFKRRNSPEGVAGFGDMGVVRVTAVDVDVKNLLARFAPVLVA